MLPIHSSFEVEPTACKSKTSTALCSAFSKNERDPLRTKLLISDICYQRVSLDTDVANKSHHHQPIYDIALCLNSILSLQREILSSAMSPNPQHIDFLNIFHHDDPAPEEQEDSGFFSCSQSRICSRYSSQLDHEILSNNEKELTKCGFYYPDVNSAEAMKMLKNSKMGTFLIRNSSDSRHLFSLSVKTKRGATSVRIMYQEGLFFFDCDERIRKRMPRFESVLRLVDHHVQLSSEGVNNSWRWEEKSGRKNMVLDLSAPYRISPPSLMHLCKLEVNKSFDRLHNQIFTPSLQDKVIQCIENYPYSI